MNVHLYTAQLIRIIIEPTIEKDVAEILLRHDLKDITIIPCNGRGTHGPARERLARRLLLEVILPDRKVNAVLLDLREMMKRGLPFLFYIEQVQVVQGERFL